jgi:hypothetical protein
MALLVVSRKYRYIWSLGYELSFRSSYQTELLRLHRVPVLVHPSHEGDGVGDEAARFETDWEERACRWLDRIGAILYPRCAVHRDTKVVLIPRSDRHECPQCREDLQIV